MFNIKVTAALFSRSSNQLIWIKLVIFSCWVLIMSFNFKISRSFWSIHSCYSYLLNVHRWVHFVELGHMSLFVGVFDWMRSFALCSLKKLIFSFSLMFSFKYWAISFYLIASHQASNSAYLFFICSEISSILSFY